VNGDAGVYAASGNEGANIEIKGNAGDFLCGPLAGELNGMSGGRVVVRKNAGARAGDRLRRGVVIIEGDAGDELGARFIAGTIFLLGKPAGRVGYLNKRGTIALAQPRDFGPTYIDCGPQDLTFARMYSRSLKEISAGAASLFSGKLRRFGGDTSVYGKGEILPPA
ncbi:MAG: formylmethanofuran dehydrogenase subunit C, partial [Methylocystis sp.]|nr:formylmethanofuran dehydrogenase subunit C [Methylocystis sp.]